MYRFLSSFATISLLFSAGAMATPANKKAAGNHFDYFLSAKLSDCTLCHQAATHKPAERLEDIPHNAFGARLRELGAELKAKKLPWAISDRLKLVANEDADKDGVANLDEILLGSFPGDAKDKPTVLELAGLASKQAAFEKFSARYAWEPFKPLKRPALPAGFSGHRNPIDAFVDEQLAARELTALGDASPAILARRIYLDLIGLAPTPAQVAAFETAMQRQPQAAVGQLVTQLLDDPRYGERWGRHFMDIWRYSDWDGYKEAVRLSQPHIWRWRDWIVESLNAGKPYDRMVQEMLAGDELAPEDNNTLRATGFLVRNYQADRLQWMDNVVEHTSKAFMGLTMNCVKCHDHKYDPIPQEDYYHIRAVFEPYNVRTDPVPGSVDTAKAGMPRAYDQSLSPVTYLFQRGDERNPVKDKPIAPGVPTMFADKLQVKQVSLPLVAKQPEKREYFKAAMLADASTATMGSERVKMLQQQFQLEALEDRGVSKTSKQWQDMALLIAGSQRKLAVVEAREAKIAADEAVAKAPKAKLAAAKTKAAEAAKKLAAAEKASTTEAKATDYKPRELKTYPDSSTGRRLAFAKWLTSREDPLFARVAMNHLWLRHFGVGIVATPDDFGANGKKPTHPALLDWLAAEFIDSGYDLKHMHRLIMTSSTYLRASGQADAKDPDNVWYGRATNRRMEGELVRDNLLNIAGLLDITEGGPDIPNEEAETTRRRSIYLRQAQEKMVEFFQIFDGARPTECYQRERSIKPHQALALANSKLSLDASTALEQQLSAQCGADYQAFITEAFQRILNRAPKPDELKLSTAFITSPEREPQRARQQFIGVLFNHNDFVTIR